MTILALVLSQITVIIFALRSKTLGLRQYFIIFLITLLQVAIISLYLYVVTPPAVD